MLNTQSRSTSLMIWLSIATICVTSLWSMLALGPPGDLITIRSPDGTAEQYTFPPIDDGPAAREAGEQA